MTDESYFLRSDLGPPKHALKGNLHFFFLTLLYTLGGRGSEVLNFYMYIEDF